MELCNASAAEFEKKTTMATSKCRMDTCPGDWRVVDGSSCEKWLTNSTNRNWKKTTGWYSTGSHSHSRSHNRSHARSHSRRHRDSRNKNENGNGYPRRYCCSLQMKPLLLLLPPSLHIRELEDTAHRYGWRHCTRNSRRVQSCGERRSNNRVLGMEIPWSFGMSDGCDWESLGRGRHNDMDWRSGCRYKLV